ncbi:MAG: tRNA (adenosine(37)-N6)-threonylcarbamoyltransferase complex dimerization subunit type 1 TsaB [Solirubrobacterales bacterium]
MTPNPKKKPEPTVRVLCLDTATPVCGVAVADEYAVCYELIANNGLDHSRSLMTMVDSALKALGLTLNSLTAIAVTSGPGSFTGLRIGLAAAKGLAMAAGKPLIGVPTLEALAYTAGWGAGIICPVLNARKGEVYTAVFQGGESLTRLTEDAALSPAGLAALLTERAAGAVVTFVGDGWPVIAQTMSETGIQSRVPPAAFALPRPAALAQLAVQRCLQRQFDDVLALTPIYIRLSEAEVKLAQKRGELST